jgi:hypothetical protein
MQSHSDRLCLAAEDRMLYTGEKLAFNQACHGMYRYVKSEANICSNCFSRGIVVVKPEY